MPNQELNILPIKNVARNILTQQGNRIVNTIKKLTSNLPIDVNPVLSSDLTDVRVFPDGSVEYAMEISLAENMRDSLVPDEYPEKRDMTVLFNNGWNHKKTVRGKAARVHGYWETASKEVWSKPDREGEHFVNEAVKSVTDSRVNVVYDKIYDGDE